MNHENSNIAIACLSEWKCRNTTHKNSIPIPRGGFGVVGRVQCSGGGCLDGSRIAGITTWSIRLRRGGKACLWGTALWCQVWQPDGLTFNSTLRGPALGGAIAQLRFRTTPSMLARMKSYEQRLSLGTATLTTRISSERGKIELRTFIPAQTDALVMEVNDTVPGRTPVSSSWRLGVPPPGAAGDGVLLIADRLSNGTEYHYALAVGVSGVRAMAGPAGPDAVQRMSFTGRKYTIYAAFAASSTRRWTWQH